MIGQILQRIMKHFIIILLCDLKTQIHNITNSVGGWKAVALGQYVRAVKPFLL